MIVFLHIPKTGGTTFYWMLRRIYGDGYKLVPSMNQRCGGVWQDAWGKLSHYQCVSGHIDTRMLDDIRRRVPVTIITMLRDPVDRMLSLYHWYKTEPQRYQPRVSQMTFAQFVRHPDDTWLFLDNGATRQLSGNVGRRRVDGDDFRRAVETLGAVPVIGLTERYDETLARWAALFGWDDVSYERKLVQEGRLRREHVEPALIAEVYERQQYDIQLYLYALNRDWGVGRE